MRVDTAVILAGGKSSRMRRDKSLLPFGESPTLAQYQYSRVQEIFSRVYISTKVDKFDFQANLIFDESEIFSPLLAISSILERVASPVFIIGVDMPHLSLESMERILDSFSLEFDAIIAKSNHHREPLCGVYNPSILSLIRDLIDRDIHKLNYLLSLSKVKEVEILAENEFTNLNYPEDYQEAILNFDKIPKKY